MSETGGFLPPPKHVGSNVFVWAVNVVEGDNFYASPEDMREGVKCPEAEALYRVRLIRVGNTPTIYKKVWWDDDKADDSILVEKPESDFEDDYIVNPMEHGDVYPTSEMAHLEGDWYYADWMWREAYRPEEEYRRFEQDFCDNELFERVVVYPDPAHSPWDSQGDDPNAIYECLLKLAPHKQEREVDDHPMCPQVRVTVEIEIEPGTEGWVLYVVEHYFVEV